MTLDGPTLAKIFLGDIKTWDDPAIQKLNPGVKLPSRAIAVVHRSDGSGTTFNFTNYLSKVSPEWKSKVGATAVEWPAGIGAKGNEGVSNNVLQTKGAIGYVEYAYAKQNKMTFDENDQQGRPTVAPNARELPGRGGQRRLGPCAGLLSDSDRPAGRQVVADHRRHFHPDAQAAEGSRRRCGSVEVLLLGLRPGRQNGGGA